MSVSAIDFVVVLGSGADSRPQQEPDYNMDNNPLYITRKKPTIKKKEPHIYETVS